MGEIDEDLRVHRCEKHYVFYPEGEAGIIMVAILHERMDKLRHVRDRL